MAACWNLSLVARRITLLVKEKKEEGVLKELCSTCEDLLPNLVVVEKNLQYVDAEKKRKLNPAVKQWMEDVQDVLNDAENLLNNYEKKRLTKKIYEKKLNDVLVRLKGFKDYGEIFSFRKVDNEEEIINQGSSSEHQQEAEEVFLWNYQKDEIIKILLGNDDEKLKVKVVSIVGGEGIGKTTLAKHVYDDAQIKQRFVKRIWRPVFSEVLEKDLVLSDTPFLVVLDGEQLSYGGKWNSLIKSLQVANGSGAVVVIMQLGSVAEECMRSGSEGYIIRLSDLNENQSNILFENIAIPIEDEENVRSYKTSVGFEIVRKCGGHTLVITAMASMLRDKKSTEDWRRFKKEFEDDNVGIGLLKLCFDNLPLSFKHCFAYCSLFPIGKDIDVGRLIQMWLAQGFITDVQQGYQCVKYLIQRRFLLVSGEEAESDDDEMKKKAVVTKCKLHKLMHNLALSVARDHCRNFSKPPPPQSADGRSSSSKIFHARFDFDLASTKELEKFGADKMRTIISSGQARRRYSGINVITILEKISNTFRYLQALDMHASGLQIVPCCIGKLKLLKYLDLSENESIVKLPESITHLINLQTLRLSSCSNLTKLPTNFGKLVNLQYLEIDGCINLTSLPPKLDEMKKLELSPQVLQSLNSLLITDVDYLKRLSEKFHIRKWRLNLEDKDDVDSYLNEMPKEIQSLSIEWKISNSKSTIQELTLCTSVTDMSITGFQGELIRCPELPKLVKLSLNRCANLTNLDELDQISNLKVLVLDDLPNLEYISSSSSLPKLLSSLEELWLTELPKLKTWWENEVNDNASSSSFKSLSKLVIHDCPHLSSMPLFPNLDEDLVMDRIGLEMLEKTIPHIASSSSSSSSGSAPLSNLKNMRIAGIKDFDAVEIEWGAFKNLRSLTFDCLPKLKNLPSDLQNVGSLEELHVWRCTIKEIPGWISKLEKLEKLVIRVCPFLKKLPAELESLKIRTLEIKDCNMLLKRCEEDIGADWEKIKNISKRNLGPIFRK
ncbi:hypothetical protein CsatA_002822 [Cannabis sativa]